MIYFWLYIQWKDADTFFSYSFLDIWCCFSRGLKWKVRGLWSKHQKKVFGFRERSIFLFSSPSWEAPLWVLIAVLVWVSPRVFAAVTLTKPAEIWAFPPILQGCFLTSAWGFFLQARTPLLPLLPPKGREGTPWVTRNTMCLACLRHFEHDCLVEPKHEFLGGFGCVFSSLSLEILWNWHKFQPSVRSLSWWVPMEVLVLAWSGANSPCLLLFQQILAGQGEALLVCSYLCEPLWGLFFSRLEDNCVITTLGYGFSAIKQCGIATSAFGAGERIP